MPLLILLLIIFNGSPCFSQTPNGFPDQVWEVGERRWSIEEERRFEQWVEETITEEFFIRYDIPTDCADAVYAIRWIYARIHHLPAAATTKQGRFVGHWSTDWKDLPTDPEWHKDERFRAALFYLFPRTWTGTLPLDTYPITISPDSVRPGTLFLITESHTGIIAHVFRDGSHAHPLQTWESALPIKVQKLSLRYFFSVRPESNARSGLVKFRWPISENGEWKYLSIREHPFYSEEQYSRDFYKTFPDFVEAVAKRIDPNTYAPMEKMGKVMGTITRFLKERVPIVQEGYQQCHGGGCPEASELWEVYSTPGRDGTIVQLMGHLSEIIESIPLDKEVAKGMMKTISIDISNGRSITFAEAYENHLWFSPHPEDSIEARWGLEKCEMIRAQTRATRDAISFIEKTYRKKDPRYADFSIRQQQQILGRLSGEWMRSECSDRSPERSLVRSQVRRLKTAQKPWFIPHPETARLGPKGCERIRAEVQATNDSIAFIEKTYRKKDPEYADFSIRQQQYVMEKLNEEWTRSECSDRSRTGPRTHRKEQVRRE